MNDFDRFLADAIKPGEAHEIFPGRQVRLGLMENPVGGIVLMAQQAMQMAARLIDCAHVPGHPPMHFADGRKPTDNERHLMNLMSWRQKEAAEAKEAAAVLAEQLNVATTRAQRFRDALLRVATHIDVWSYRGVSARSIIADALEMSLADLQAAWEEQ